MAKVYLNHLNNIPSLSMHEIVDVSVEADILEANLQIAKSNKKRLEKNGVKAYDFMGAIGSGKTLLIEKIVDILKENGKRCGAIAGDVSGDEDYQRFKRHNIPAINVNTGKECHLDAHLIDHALDKLDLKKIDRLFIENVGNLVCPADFPLGTEKRAVVISVTEGEDMIKKHPVIFQQSDLIVINKIDLAEIMGIDPQVLVNDAKRIAPHTKVVLSDAKHGKGVEELIEALKIL